MLKFLLVTFTFCLNASLFAQAADTIPPPRNNLFAIPIVFTSPETSWSFGALGTYTFRFKGERSESRPSQVSVATAYTLNKQILFYVPFRLYWNDEKYLTYGEIGYYKYNYFFHGIGNDQDSQFEELYDVNYPRIRWNMLYQINPKTSIGLRYQWDDYDVKTARLDPEGQLTEGEITGSQGGVVSGIGAVMNYDSRDNIIYPHDGFFIETVALYNTTALGSDFDYTKFSVDVATYLETKWQHILALNFYSEFIGGDAPFNELAFLGGNRKMRGYYGGRYRDNHLLTVQAEYRFPLFWKFKMAVFAGYGSVADEISNFEINDFRLAYGAGLRYQINSEGLHIRADYGIGGVLEEGSPVRSSGLYLTLGEAF
ncbi:MAG: BamA/TamA family outer membrane protein [Saprospiraceae bacterium]